MDGLIGAISGQLNATIKNQKDSNYKELETKLIGLQKSFETQLRAINQRMDKFEELVLEVQTRVTNMESTIKETNN